MYRINYTNNISNVENVGISIDINKTYIILTNFIIQNCEKMAGPRNAKALNCRSLAFILDYVSSLHVTKMHQYYVCVALIY